MKSLKNLLTIGLGLAAVASQAQNTYRNSVREIKAGIAVIQSYTVGGQQANSTPFIWYNLDNNAAVKPNGWSFVNPLSGGSVDADTAARWALINTVIGGGSPVVGSALNPTQAAYWEVNLSNVSVSQLAQLDVLAMPVHGRTSYSALLKLNPLEREKLRQYVDGGGILWVDLQGPFVGWDTINGGPLQFTYTQSGTGTAINLDTFSPILSSPNTVSATQLYNADAASHSGGITSSTLTNTALLGILATPPAEGARFTTVAADSSGSLISYAQMGDGFMVVTTRAFARTLNRIPQGAGYVENNQYYAKTPAFDRASDTAAKLTLNMLNLRANAGASSMGGRRTNSVSVESSAPIIQNFSTSAVKNASSSSSRGPVTYKGVVLAAGDDGKLYCYDANPATDEDGDGNTDDGAPDYAGGKSYDLIWSSSALPGPISAPVAYEVPNATGGRPVDQVAVVDVNGTLHVFNVFPTSGGLLTATNTESYNITAPGGFAVYNTSTTTQLGPYSPIYQDGLLILSDNQASLGTYYGRVWIADPASGTRVSSSLGDFYVGGQMSSSLPEISEAATAGYIPIQDNSGGLDRVVYLPIRNLSSVPGPNGAAGLASLWLGVKGERPVDYQVSAGVLQITTRASLQGLRIYTSAGTAPDPNGIRITLLRANGDPYTEDEMAPVFTGTVTDPGSGVLNVPLSGTSLPADVAGIRVDYTIDWGAGPGSTAQVLRGLINFPDEDSHPKRVIGNVALSANGTVFASVGQGSTPGGAIYALQETGRGQFKLLYRYEVNGTHTFTLSSGTTVNLPATFTDTDDIQSFSAFLSGPITNLRLASAPAVRGDNVFVLATGNKGFVPVTVLISLKSAPEPVEIRIPDVSGGFSIVQPDISSSSTKSAPERISQLQPGQYSYSKDPGATYGVIRIDNLMATTRGPIVNALSASQSVFIRQSGVPDTKVDPDSNGGNWSPMNWYMVWSGYGEPTNPVVTGDNVFFGCSSVAPNLLTNGTLGTPRGLILGVEGNIPTGDEFLRDDPLRPWNKQLILIKTTTSPQGNSHVLSPQFKGSTSMSDFAVRLTQTVLQIPGATAPGAPFGLSAGEGGLFSINGSGMYAFSRAEIGVADKGRVGRYDGVGNPFWLTEGFSLSGKLVDETDAASSSSLVQPERIYPISKSLNLVVDSGANQVLWMDNSGTVTRRLNGFILDSAHVVSGFQTGESASFNRPNDVATWNEYVDATTKSVSNPSALEYWVHYMIADKGNNRLVELIDRFQVNSSTRQIGAPVQVSGVNQRGVLYWNSPKNLSGSGHAYNSVVRLAPTSFSGGAAVLVAATSSEILVYTAADQPKIFSSVTIPSVAANAYWDRTTQDFSTSSSQNPNLVLNSVRSMTARWQDDGTSAILAIMFTDNSGVYEFDYNTGAVRWMLPSKAFLALRGVNGLYGGAGQPTTAKFASPFFDPAYALNPRGFVPSYAKRMANGDVLLVNAFGGRTLGDTTYDGEIMQISGLISSNPTSDNNSIEGFGFNKTNLGFGAESIRMSLGTLTNARKLLSPTFADRK